MKAAGSLPAGWLPTMPLYPRCHARLDSPIPSDLEYPMVPDGCALHLRIPGYYYAFKPYVQTAYGQSEYLSTYCSCCMAASH